MLGMTEIIIALVRLDSLAEGSSADEHPEFMQDSCNQASELLGLCLKARQVHPYLTTPADFLSKLSLATGLTFLCIHGSYW